MAREFTEEELTDLRSRKIILTLDLLKDNIARSQELIEDIENAVKQEQLDEYNERETKETEAEHGEGDKEDL